MLTRRSAAVGLCAGILTLTGCASAVRPGLDTGPSVLAEVGANAVTVADVREHLAAGDGGPAVLTPGFQTLESAHAAWARLRDRTTAMTLLDHSRSQTEEQFLQAARREGAFSVGTAALDRAGRGADVLVARAAFALGRQGATGLVEGEDGSWWLVRLGRVELVSPRWDQQMVSRAKAVMAWDREQAHLRQLAQRLETRWKVVVHEDRLEAARPASPDGE